MSETPLRLERAAFGTLAASLGLVQFNISAAQIAFGVAALLWIALIAREKHGFVAPAFFWFLAAYAVLTLASALFSSDRAASLVDTKQLVLFLMVPMVMRLARGTRAMTTLNVVIAAGAVGALVGVVEATMFDFDNLSRRPMGSLTHYMTYSGIIMLVLSVTIARLVFYPAQRVWPGIAIPALAVALAATQTRNAWIGALAAIACLLAIRQLRLLLVVPVLIGAFLVAAPANIKDRAFSIFDRHDESNRDRMQMAGMGVRIVKDHPVFGVGPDMIKVVYPQYRPADAVHPSNPHLHNVPIQIAAERGLPALAVWLMFIVTALAGMSRLLKSQVRALAAAGVAAIVAMLVAGLFEYNFGDSEFLMLFLGLITLPFAANAATGRSAVAARM